MQTFPEGQLEILKLEEEQNRERQVELTRLYDINIEKNQKIENMRKEIEVLQSEILDYKDTNYHMKTQIGELKRNFNEIRNGNIEKLE